MVAKKEDGTVVKKLFKPIEDSVKEGMDSRNNIFVLSKNKVTFCVFCATNEPSHPTYSNFRL